MSLEGNVVRSSVEIMELAKECVEIEKAVSTQFPRMTYEQGIRAAIRWMYFSTANHPLQPEIFGTVTPTVEHSEVKPGEI